MPMLASGFHSGCFQKSGVCPRVAFEGRCVLHGCDRAVSVSEALPFPFRSAQYIYLTISWCDIQPA